ncbi:hypothetical protein [Phyllobacterium sp. 628]|uniref:hypothetical protein n=1 Tax=Phyllobacterium sp. 628 TaxID=2718938 RepID=UPI001AEDBD98|nr:hypothetical protein [Phyllobacterium sp. 628]
MEKFIEKKFRKSTVSIITQANVIIDEYRAMGFSLTLRQLYYQFVARGIIPNKQTEYKRLGEIINDARLAGMIDWSSIEDRTRNVRQVNMWSSPQSILDAVASQYLEDPWDTQRYAPEVWIEKDALVGVIEPICNRLRVPFFACRGYTSQSEQYRAGKRFAASYRNGKRPLVLHLGDHDPSGLDMTRDNGDRLRMFARHGVMVRRLALNMEQVEQYSPPPNPAKETDSRFENYREQYGDESWELDALNPPIIEALIQEALDDVIDADAWQEVIEREEANKGDLEAVAHRWDDVSEFLRAE